MRRITVVTTLLVMASAAGAQAQEQKAAPAAKASAAAATSGVTKIYGWAKNYVLKSAEQFPEEKYSYRPTPEVRTFGQILGHIADAHDYICGTIAGTGPSGEQGVNEKIEGKANIIAALKKSFDSCDATVAKLTDADLTKQVNLFGNDVPLSAALTLLAAHDFEHYGNLVTYMRSNGMVPPSSQQN